MSDTIEVCSAAQKGSEAMSSVSRIAERIITLHREMYEESPTNMKLQKLCYYAQGLFLAERKGTPLFPEDFQAWALGPVCRELYDKYRGYRYLPINTEVNESALDFDLDEHVEAIVAAYGRYDAAALSTMTHKEEPWLSARGATPDGGNCENVISKKIMQQFFSSILQNANE